MLQMTTQLCVVQAKPLVQKYLIRPARYIKKSQNCTLKTIVTDFAYLQKRDAFLIAAKSYNKAKPPNSKLNTEIMGFPGKRMPIYIAEYLPPSMKKLFILLGSQFAMQNDYQYCWTTNGKLFLAKENSMAFSCILSES